MSKIIRLNDKNILTALKKYFFRGWQTAENNGNLEEIALLLAAERGALFHGSFRRRAVGLPDSMGRGDRADGTRQQAAFRRRLAIFAA